MDLRRHPNGWQPDGMFVDRHLLSLERLTKHVIGKLVICV
jgi:hypothetical protein